MAMILCAPHPSTQNPAGHRLSAVGCRRPAHSSTLQMVGKRFDSETAKKPRAQKENGIPMTWTKSVALPTCPIILQDVRKLDISDGAEVRQGSCLLQIQAI